MIQRCSIIQVLEVFFKEPLRVHFIREISKRINLAQTSTRNHIKELTRAELIKEKENRPFNGFVANRDNDKFIFYKRAYNLYSLYGLKNLIIEGLNPKAIIVFGSYSRGEDIETSDIDILILSKIKKELNFRKIEQILNRKLHVIFAKNIEEIDEPLRSNILNGIVLYGSI